MHKLGIINLGLTPNDFERFKQSVLGVTGKNWEKEVYTSHYKEINPTKIAASCDALVLSPGDALVGILDYDRARRAPQIGPLYNLIANAVIKVPTLGINGGHQSLVSALGCGIEAIPDDDKGEYHKKRVYDLRKVDDRITKGIDEITMTLSNNYRVLPLGLPYQKERWGQSKIKHIASLDNFAVISSVETTSGALVYGTQFNIEDGTKPIFENFFDLAHQYLQKKEM